jgi:methylenetetrahydrofolate dehydrogenase (NADP+)/methenyltetrahydrofolate cyclohydrolase
MKFINGKKIAGQMLERIKSEVAELGFKPLVVDVLVGDDPVSASFVKIKKKTAFEAGMDFKLAQFPQDITQEELIGQIREINKYAGLCGLIIQLPLPKHLVKEEILDCIEPRVDIDCIGKSCAKNFYSGKSEMVPPTAAAILHIIEQLKIDFTGKKILVIGQGSLVGKPFSFLLSQKGLDVATADRSTSGLQSLSLGADIIITGAGKPKLVTREMVKPGTVIIDAGTSEAEGSIVGDVDTESLKDTDCLVSPVPGGVGPVTVAMLLNNALSVAKNIS